MGLRNATVPPSANRVVHHDLAAPLLLAALAAGGLAVVASGRE
ncbi:hypothetical protein [Streptomyces sp. NPDC059631]